MSMTLGEAFQAAQERSDFLRATTVRKVRVRIYPSHPDAPDAVTILATIATKTGPELEAMSGCGPERILWSELEKEPAKLVELVNQKAAQVEAAVLAAPPPARRPNPRTSPDKLRALEKRIRDTMIEDGHALARSEQDGIPDGDYYWALTLAAVEAAAVFGRGAGCDVSFLQTELNRANKKLAEEERAELVSLTLEMASHERASLH